MLKEEKILREFINLILEEADEAETTQQNEDITFRDLRGFFANTGKTKKEAAKKLAKFGLKFAVSVFKGGALGTLVDALPGNIDGMAAEAAQNAVEDIMDKAGASNIGPLKALAKFYGINEKPGTKYLSLPNEVSNLVDDDVEAEFIEYFLELIKDKAQYPDDKIVSKNFAESEFKKYTESVHKKTTGASVNKS